MTILQAIPSSAPRASHFVNFALHDFADAGRQIVKGFGESGRPDLERGSHNYYG
jgi:hypothetical protein